MAGHAREGLLKKFKTRCLTTNQKPAALITAEKKTKTEKKTLIFRRQLVYKLNTLMTMSGEAEGRQTIPLEQENQKLKKELEKYKGIVDNLLSIPHELMAKDGKAEENQQQPAAGPQQQPAAGQQQPRKKRNEKLKG